MNRLNLPLETLAYIRRRVDKATKKADAQRRELTKEHGCDTAIPDKHVVGVSHDDWLVVFKGDYSVIFPASIGATVQHYVRPSFVVANTKEEAHYVATWGPTDAAQVKAMNEFQQRQRIHHEALAALAVM